MMAPNLGRSSALVIAVAVLATLVCLISASATLAASPWWHMSSGSRPGYLKPGVAKSEEQELIIAPGTAFELKVAGNSIGLFESEPFPLSAFPAATAANIQTALETAYGPGNVTVSGGPGGEAPLKIVSVAGGADTAVAPLEVGITLGGSVEAKVLSKGSPDGTIVVTASNLGDAAANGSTSEVRLADKLPPHLKAVSIEAISGNKSVSLGGVSCTLAPLECRFAGTLPPFAEIEARIGVVLETGADSGEVNEATVSGAQAAPESVRRPITVSDDPTPFGVEDFELTPEEEGGGIDTQAGSHPFQLTTTFTLNQTADAMPAELPHDVTFKWPPGLIGNPTLFPQCTLGQFLAFKGEEFVNRCSAGDAVGVAMITINEPAGDLGTPGPDRIVVPVFNMEPAAGEPARFGFLAPGTPVFIDASVRTGGDYGVTVRSEEVSQTAAFLTAEVTIWGVPGDSLHDGARGNGCLRDSQEGESLPCSALEEEHPSAFLSLPRSCPAEPLRASVQADSWARPGIEVEPPEQALIGPLHGCNRLPFSPSIEVTPESTEGSSPTGLRVDVHNPQEQSLAAHGLSEADMKSVRVLLPEGMSINPSSANGLEACSEQQVGFTGIDASGTAQFSAAGPRSEGFCPDASKIGTAKVTTPLLAHPLEGAVYVAAQGANPFGSLIAMYLVAEDPVSGVLVKLAGQAHLSASGQIEAIFENTPQVPFEDAEVSFFGEGRAPLATPSKCNPSYSASATFGSWAGGPPITSTSSFGIDSGPKQKPCADPRPFNPSLVAGTTSIQAAGFSPLTATVSREDGDQELHSITVRTPPGLSGILAGVKLCPEPQASLGFCGPESLVGETTVSVGVGDEPFTVKGGRVYLTGAYEGAPFGLSVVTPAKAGPYDLAKETPCDCVVVRAKVEVDPHTAALTATTDSSGPYAIPSILDGIPLEIKRVNVAIDREHFTFDPTNCAQQAITGSISSVEGAISTQSVPFQVANCTTLKFAPKFSVSTSGKTSKANGASLTTKLSYPKAAQGTQTNIAKVKVDLPKQLPSRLSTLQKACLAAVFEANPADCPASSIVGHAKVTTPVLPVPLSGPAYFVSHGNEAFPSLTMVLQGYGVTVDLIGATLIRKGITSTTFKTVPDVPFNTFELTLPEGRFSALAAFGNLCKTKLAMPTLFVAQNGAEIHQSTKIAVTGCKKQARKRSLKGSEHKRQKGKKH